MLPVFETEMCNLEYDTGIFVFLRFDGSFPPTLAMFVLLEMLKF